MFSSPTIKIINGHASGRILEISMWRNEATVKLERTENNPFNVKSVSIVLRTSFLGDY
jgi:hypothetical protein